MDNKFLKHLEDRNLVTSQTSSAFNRFKQRLDESLDRDKSPTVLEARSFISTVKSTEISDETGKIIDKLEKLLRGKEDRSFISETEQTYLQKLKDAYYTN